MSLLKYCISVKINAILHIKYAAVAVETLPELVVLVDFVFPCGLEYPVVFLPQGLFTLWCLQIS